MASAKWLTKSFISQLANIPEAYLVDYSISFAIKKHENYCGTLYRLRITKKDNKKHSLIVKTLPVGEFALKYVLEARLFERETNFYTKLLPDLKRDIRVRECFDFCPGGYDTSKRFDFIVIDDLCASPDDRVGGGGGGGGGGKSSGYEMAERSNRFDSAHCDLALRALVKLHVLSWVKAASSTAERDFFVRNYRDGIYTDSNKNYVYPYLECSLSCLKAKIESWNVPSSYVVAFNSFLENLWENLKKVTEPLPLQDSVDFNVLNHGDFWANNVMFQYAQPDGHNSPPINAKLVDFQNLRFCSPILDLLYFYHSTAQEEISYDDLLENYCEYFRQDLALLSDEKRKSPFDVQFLRKETEKKQFFGLFAACTVMQSVLSRPTVNDVDTDELSVSDVQNAESPLSKMYDGDHFQQAFLKKLYHLIDFYDVVNVQ